MSGSSAFCATSTLADNAEVNNLTRLEKLRAQRAAVIEIAAAHGATNVRVFGSVARGDDEPDSDIDLLVDMDTESLLPLFELADRIEALLGERVEVATVEHLKPGVAESALREAIPL